MTQFSTLELLYTQFSNLVDEINAMIEREDYDAALMRLVDKDKLIKKLIAAKKTVKFSDEDVAKLVLIENELMEKEKHNLEYLTELRNKTGVELAATRAKTKITSAYEVSDSDGQGILFDVSE